MKEYGGYFPLELPKRSEYYTSNDRYEVQALNSGRAAIYSAILDSGVKKIYLPYYNCQMSTEPVEAAGVTYDYYFLDDKLLPKGVQLKGGEMLLWINYFGNKSKTEIQDLAERYEHLIIDNCHAFYTEPVPKAYNIYSCRKFFGVSDGAYLIKDKFSNIGSASAERDVSYSRAFFLMKSIECGTNASYGDSLENEGAIGKRYCRMSLLSRRILSSIDYPEIQEIRKRNLRYVNEQLKEINQLQVDHELGTQIHYPLLFKSKTLREQLISHKIYTPTWWRHVPEQCGFAEIETYLSQYTCFLPIDQRYDIADMDYIVSVVKKVVGQG